MAGGIPAAEGAEATIRAPAEAVGTTQAPAEAVGTTPGPEAAAAISAKPLLVKASAPPVARSTTLAAA